MLMLLWRSLGFPLVFVKAAMDKTVDWIGAQISIVPRGVRARAKQDILDDLTKDMDAIESSNVVTKKLIRSFVGRGSHAATVVTTWRPFLSEFWAALTSQPSGAPPNTKTACGDARSNPQ